MSRIKQRSAFDQLSEFDRRRIVAYRDCGLFFRKSVVVCVCVGRNQTTVMGIMTVECRRVRRTDVVDRIHLVGTGKLCAWQCRLQQSGLSARGPLIGLPLTQNHRRLRHQWCNERRMWGVEWNEVIFSGESRICLQHHDDRIQVWRHRGERMLNSCIMRRHTGPVPGIIVWGGT
ncbi:transposable element Tcb1 transposase [Trichonephila clavipes]|nr:transposable element Tcb1 transposase [Trichonephila clavipes]